MIERWLTEAERDPRLVHVERRPLTPAVTARLRTPLPNRVAHLVPTTGLWRHQAAAIDALRGRESIVLATPTASGKSLAYRIPIAEAVSEPIRPSTAVLVFPTKALAQDQLRSFTEMDFGRLEAAVYDGDSSAEERSWARDQANVLLTNPEMLHFGLLPNHKRWATFLMRLRYVVVDEMHVLRGVFGSHVAHVLRRLVRLCHHYGSDPTFVFCSATVGEPARLATELYGRPVRAIVEDGSPRGERVVALWDPTLGSADRRRRSANRDAVEVAASLVSAGMRTLVFCRSRRNTELVAAALRRCLGGGPRDRVRAYRSGYLVVERREIEAAFVGGELDAVVATSALELGIDIGGLDAVVMCGFPGTVASMWQQVGRAGRGGEPSVAVLVAGDDQLDRWVMSHPLETFDRQPERAVTNVDNPMIADAHLACAAHELPLAHHDDLYWLDQLDDAVRRGVLDDRLSLLRSRGRDAVAIWNGGTWPSRGVGLRSASRGELQIVDREGELIGSVDGARAFQQAHPGAVYLHQGRAFEVIELDLEAGRVVVEDSDGETYTQARTVVGVSRLEASASRRVGRAELSVGDVEVTTNVTGYQVLRARDHRRLGSERLELPPMRLSTRGVWYRVDRELLGSAEVGTEVAAGALHAIEHAVIGLLPLFAICDRWDVGGISGEHLGEPMTEPLREPGGPTILVYDAYPGGAGIADLAYEHADRHLAAALGLIERCGCDSGCPSCVHSPGCGSWNEPLEKGAAARLLRAVLYR